ncbi:phage regulatory CII family protein [uncultured Alcanivorax sp.]|uniref:phage regulatory CII family protein n=1 Tax=uncultured Alcanivorax sp. TaxID=191215 RepID=UPI0030D6E548
MSITRMSRIELAQNTLPDLKTALVMTAKRQGIKKLAATYDLNPQQFYNNLNLNDTDRNPTLQQFELITEYARDHDDVEQILDALALITGCVWLPKPDAGETGKTELFGEVAELVTRVGKMTSNTRDALKDGRVDADELAILEKDLLRLFQSGCRLVEAARLFDGVTHG